MFLFLLSSNKTISSAIISNFNTGEYVLKDIYVLKLKTHFALDYLFMKGAISIKSFVLLQPGWLRNSSLKQSINPLPRSSRDHIHKQVYHRLENFITFLYLYWHLMVRRGNDTFIFIVASFFSHRYIVNISWK